MNLTKEEEKILAGEQGYAYQKAMEILVALGKTYDAPRLIPITSAHLSGVSYKGLGDAGLEFLQELANEFPKVKVKTTLNPGGVSPKMNPPQDFIEKQRLIVDAYKAMGIEPTLTCTPYYVGNTPKKGEHIAWAESSAVVYANSILGAYTNREGGPSALAAALIGKTPEYGMHLDENRKPKLTLKIIEKMFGFEDFAALGYYAGTTYKDLIINFNFSSKPNSENLKGLSAAIAAAGSVPIFTLGEKCEETIEVGYPEIDTTFQNFDSDKKPDIACVGCPHSSMGEVKKIARMLKGHHLKNGMEFWIFTAEQIRKEIELDGYEEEIEKAGAKLITDTCMVVAPLEDLGFKCMLTNSAKAAFYTRTMCGIDTRLMSLKEIVKAVLV